MGEQRKSGYVVNGNSVRSTTPCVILRFSAVGRWYDGRRHAESKGLNEKKRKKREVKTWKKKKNEKGEEGEDSKRILKMAKKKKETQSRLKSISNPFTQDDPSP